MPRVNDAVKWVQYDPEPEYGIPGFEGWRPHELGAATNCALCTAAALITTTDINDPLGRKTAGIVNVGLQQELGHELGEEKLQAIWDQYVKDRRRDPIFDDEDSLEWKQWQRDDAFVVYARNAPSLQSQLRKMSDATRFQTLADQIIGLAGYVKKKLNTNVRYSGFPGGEAQNAKTALQFMRGQPDGTKFAVFTAADLEYEPPHHWTYAEKQGGKITFKDFQLDREGKPEPPASDLPLAPNGREYKRETLETRLMIVLAFGKNVVRGGEL